MSVHSLESSLSSYFETSAPAAAGSRPASRTPSPHSNSSSKSDLELIVQRMVDERLSESQKDTESKIDTLTGRVSKLEGDLTAEQAKVTKLEGAIKEKDSQIATNDSENAILKKEKADLEREKADLEKEKADLERALARATGLYPDNYFKLWDGPTTTENKIRAVYNEYANGWWNMPVLGWLYAREHTSDVNTALQAKDLVSLMSELKKIKPNESDTSFKKRKAFMELMLK